MNKPDVLIIGAGMGGLITGAILAKKEKMKVLVLEKESEIGGRVISFGGPHGNYSEEEYRRLLRGSADIWIIRSEPTLAEIINKKGLFANYITDCAWHAMSGGERCRYALLAKLLGKSLSISPVVGMGFWSDGRWVQLNDIFKGWPKESFRERDHVARTQFSLSAEESSEYDHINVEEYLWAKTEDQNVRDYFITLAKYQFGINDPKRMSAGEWIRMQNFNQNTGLDLMRGGGTGAVTGGVKNIAKVFAEVIVESGGEIRTDARVKEVIIKGTEAKGVVVEQNSKASKIEASAIVSNLRMSKVFEIVPESYFPEELRQRIENIFTMPGILGTFELKELLETESPKSQFVLERLPGVELRGGLPALAWEQTTAVDPTRVLKGKGHIIQTWIGVSPTDPDELHHKELLNTLCEEKLSFLRKQYPRFDDILEWYIIVAAEAVYGISPSPGLTGDRRPGVKHPLVKNLYFTGDTVTQWDVGSNGTAHGAIICASAVSGKDYLSLLPPYMR